MRGFVPVMAGWLWLLGCGSDVEPTPEFMDPASVPLCCETDFGEACCGFDAFPSRLGIQLSWNSEDRVFAYIDGWIVYRAGGPLSGPDDYRPLNPQPVVEREYLDRNVVEGSLYRYRLVSVTPAGVESLPTEPIEVRPDFEPPAVPTGLVAEADSQRVALAWDPATEPDFDHFNVFRDPPFPPIVFFSVRINRFFDDAVKRDSSYTYWITAVDIGFNESMPGDSVTVLIP